MSIGLSPLALTSFLGHGVKTLLDPPVFISFGYYTHGFNQNSLFLKNTILLPKHSTLEIEMVPELGGRYFMDHSTFINFGFGVFFDGPISLGKETPLFLPLPTFSLGTTF